MIRNVLASTALVTLFATTALAGGTPNSLEQVDGKSQYSFEQRSASDIYLLNMSDLNDQFDQGYLASNLMGKSVYTADTDNEETIGEINDIIVGKDGSVDMVLIGVGGFLGIGEKDVAVAFDQLAMKQTSENHYRITTSLTREQLETAKGFERPEQLPEWMSEAYITEKYEELKRSAEESYETTSSHVAEMTDRSENAEFLAGKQLVMNESLTTDRVLGAPVYDRAFNHMGEIGSAEVATNGDMDAVIVDFGGFLGIGEKPVALSFDDVQFYEEDGELIVVVPYTQKDLEAAPTYDPDTFKSNRDGVLLN